MVEYAAYIWPAYGLSAAALLFLWVNAAYRLKRQQKHLLLLQNSLKPDRE